MLEFKLKCNYLLAETYSRLYITLKLAKNLYYYMTRLFMWYILLVILWMMQFWIVQATKFNSRIFIGT